MQRRPWLTAFTLLLLMLVLAASLPVAPVQAQSSVVRIHPNGKHFIDPSGRRFFALGYNYEGPFDRAWRMWEQFDLSLINRDLDRARAGGANTVRLFVQNPLPGEIMAGDFSKLDAVINSAAQRGLYVLLTFNDSGDRDLARVIEVNRRIAERYRGNPTILAYDLRNEPQFFTLATTNYPSGVGVPLQGTELIAIYGERVPREAIPGWRTSTSDGRSLQSSWSDEQAYAYANNVAYFREFVAASEQWTVAAPGRNIMDFPDSPEAQAWAPFWAAVNGTLATWIGLQRDAIRSADAEHLITVGWSNLLFSRLPANGALLDFHSLHRFPNPTVSSVTQILQFGDVLRRLFPNQPLLLEEIGYSTADAHADVTGMLEMAVTLGAYSRGYAGFLKWMLTDLPPVGNPREDNYGALRIDGSAKPIWHTFGAFATYLANTAAEPGGELALGGGPSYTFVGNDIVYSAGVTGNVAGLAYQLEYQGQVLLRKRGEIYFLSTQNGQIALDIKTLMPTWNGGEYRIEQREGDGWATVFAGNQAQATVGIGSLRPYRVVIPRYSDPVGPKDGCLFFPETGHNLCGAFLSYWQQHGGLAIFGYPLTEEFSEVSKQDGKSYTVQYFERNRFEYHPENAGTPYEVLLGLLGSDLTAHRRAEGPMQPVPNPNDGRAYAPETGHTLGGAFLRYWQNNGGLAVFGYPISEEFQEYNPADGKVYTVQYFERNRFEYHPEYAGTPYEVLLGLLGSQTIDGYGWR